MTIWLWGGFAALVTGLLALDLGVFHRKPHAVSIGEAFGWTAFWVALALLFNAAVYCMYEQHWLGIGLDIGHELSGRQAALQFFTGYVIEKSLSLDNIFVIAMIVAYFGVPGKYQHRLLFWGVLGAIVMRAAMITAGIVLIERIDWIIYVFGALLIITAVKMLLVRHDSLEPERNPLIKLTRRFLPVTSEFEGPRFFTRRDGRWAVTPLFLALILVESTDLLFAVDSIPAVLAVTRDPFIVFTSNVFAILGLRALYFALASAMAKFRYVKMSLVFVLAFVGVKMLLAHHHPISTSFSLAVIGALLAVGVGASVIGARRDTAALMSPLADELSDLARITYRGAKRLVVLIMGTTMLLIGAALLALPGPGLVVIVLGLVLLATEFVWARLWLQRVRSQVDRMTSAARRVLKSFGDGQGPEDPTGARGPQS